MRAILIIINETWVGICTLPPAIKEAGIQLVTIPSVILKVAAQGSIIFTPINTKIKARAGLRKRKYSMKPEIAKYRDRRPMIAKILDVKAIKRRSSTDMSGGRMPSTAGIESMAKIKSVHSTITRTTNNGVKYLRPFCVI